MRLLVSDRRQPKTRVMLIDGNLTRYSELELNVLYVHFLTKLLFFNQTSRKMNHSQAVLIASPSLVFGGEISWDAHGFFVHSFKRQKGSCITKEHRELEVIFYYGVFKNWCNLRLIHLKGSSDLDCNLPKPFWDPWDVGNFCLRCFLS